LNAALAIRRRRAALKRLAPPLDLSKEDRCGAIHGDYLGSSRDEFAPGRGHDG
jgi:hypothetical protein